MSIEQWWCTEYAHEIHEILRKRERDRFYFDNKAPQIKWRMHLVEFILDVGQQHKLTIETIHLAVYYMDIFLDNHLIRLWRLHLVALTSLRIAAKIEEKDFSLTKVEALNTMANYSREDYNALESIILKMFDWDINIPTASTFACYYIEFIVDEIDFNNKHNSYDTYEDFKNDIKSDVINIMNISLHDTKLQHAIAPSRLAAMCLAAVRWKRNFKPIWPVHLFKLTRYTWESINPDFAKLFDIIVLPREQLKIELDKSINQESELEFD